MNPILNLNEIELHPRPAEYAAPGEAAERFDARLGELSRPLGARLLGYNVTLIPPGKRAFPFHSHQQNEEMFYIIEGRGELRLGAQSYPVRSGDVIACPPGGVESAHQLINTGDQDLRFLAVSTQIASEVCEYPDSGKFAISTEVTHANGGESSVFRFVGRVENSLDYWDDE